jgi:CRP/FNR family nitrogen fixation transcriptional regulator
MERVMRDLEYTGSPSLGGLAAARIDELTIGPASLSGVRMHFERNAEIFGQGEAADYVYRVVSGAARTVRFSSEGRRQIIAFHLPGDLFGLDFALQHGFAAEAVSDADVIMVRRPVLEKAAAENGAVMRALLGFAADQMHAAQEHSVILGLKGAAERLAAFLVKMADRLKDANELDLPMSRADIADHLALTIETVSRVFSQLVRDDAISLPSARHVVLRNWRALELMQAA